MVLFRSFSGRYFISDFSCHTKTFSTGGRGSVSSVKPVFTGPLKRKDRHATDDTTFYANVVSDHNLANTIVMGIFKVGKSKYIFISFLHELSGNKKMKKKSKNFSKCFQIFFEII